MTSTNDHIIDIRADFDQYAVERRFDKSGATLTYGGVTLNIPADELHAFVEEMGRAVDAGGRLRNIIHGNNTAYLLLSSAVGARQREAAEKARQAAADAKAQEARDRAARFEAERQEAIAAAEAERQAADQAANDRRRAAKAEADAAHAAILAQVRGAQ